jgi:putative sigma-54 modulation protein
MRTIRGAHPPGALCASKFAPGEFVVLKKSHRWTFSAIKQEFFDEGETMQINLSGQQVEITEPLRQYALEKLRRLERHFDHMTTTNVVLHVEKKRHLAEATIHAKGAMLHADAEGTDMYAAIDSLSDKLDRQVLKHKEKTMDHRNNSAPKKLNGNH